MKICLSRMPEYTHLSDTHVSACWVNERNAMESGGSAQAVPAVSGQEAP